MPTFAVTETKDSSPVDAILSMVVDPTGRDVLLTLHFESNIAVRLPMTSQVAMRLWSILDQARRDNDWPEPDTPVSSEKIQ
jgi:hypothetical protein